MVDERALLVAAGGGIGDTVLASVVANALRGRFARVDALVLPEHAPIARRLPAIDGVVELDAPTLVMAGRLRRERYSAAVVTWATLLTARLPFLAGIPVRVGQARRLYSGLFTERVVVKSELGDHRTHWTQILLDYPRAIGCDTNDARPRLVTTPEDEAAATALLRVHDIAGPFAVLHPTRGLSAQRARWPIGGFVDLCAALRERGALPLLITGSPEDAPIAHAVADAAGANTVSIAGATSVGSFAALARRAAFVIAMDSGPMHVAAAVGAPTVGIFALQSDEPERWAPLGANVAVVRAAYPCPPEHRKETCPDFACVRALDVGRILAAVDAVRGVRSETV